MAGGRVDAATLAYLAQEAESGLNDVGALDGLVLLLHGGRLTTKGKLARRSRRSLVTKIESVRRVPQL